jgi:hypothetical protein
MARALPSYDVNASASFNGMIHGCLEPINNETKGIQKIALSCSIAANQSSQSRQIHIAFAYASVILKNDALQEGFRRARRMSIIADSHSSII